MRLKCVAMGLLVAVLASVAGYFVYPLFGVEGSKPECVFSGGVFIGFLLAAFLGSRCRHRCKGAAGSGGSVSLFVGNLPFKASQDELRQLFSSYGTVNAVRIVKDRQTGRARGFGFVEMAERNARKAIKALHGSEFGGRTLKVNIADEKPGPRQRDS